MSFMVVIGVAKFGLLASVYGSVGSRNLQVEWNILNAKTFKSVCVL